MHCPGRLVHRHPLRGLIFLGLRVDLEIDTRRNLQRGEYLKMMVDLFGILFGSKRDFTYLSWRTLSFGNVYAT